jgi:hypothetical protein
MLNATVHPTKAGFIFMFFSYFLFCIDKRLAICKFWGCDKRRMLHIQAPLLAYVNCLALLFV